MVKYNCWYCDKPITNPEMTIEIGGSVMREKEFIPICSKLCITEVFFCLFEFEDQIVAEGALRKSMSDYDMVY